MIIIKVNHRVVIIQLFLILYNKDPESFRIRSLLNEYNLLF
jgi:hypothetical protein